MSFTAHRFTAGRIVARRVAGSAFAFTALAACTDDPTAQTPDFLRGTPTNAEIGFVLDGLGRTLTAFQIGDPSARQVTPLGASDAITITGAAIDGYRAAVPLGNAASVAIVDLGVGTVERVFTMPSGNATGIAWADANTVLAANLIGDYVGRFALTQSGSAITSTVAVTPTPTAIAMANGAAFVVSSNYTDDFVTSLGPGVVTRIDPARMQVTGTVQVGLNPTAAAVGPDGKLYVVNTGDYFGVEGSLSIVNTQTMAVEATVPGFGYGPGAITFNGAGLAFVSSFSYGTVVWNASTRTFVRGPGNPLCAPSAAGCRGAAAAAVAPTDGRLFQAYFGSQTSPSRIFVYTPAAGNYALSDSIDVGGVGPVWLDVRPFR